MNKKEFEKLNYCLELLAVAEIISDKKKLLKNKLFKDYSEEELNKFIKFAEKKKDLLKEIIKNLTELNYNAAIKFAKDNKENYITLKDKQKIILDYIIWITQIITTVYYII